MRLRFGEHWAMEQSVETHRDRQYHCAVNQISGEFPVIPVLPENAIPPLLFVGNYSSIFCNRFIRSDDRPTIDLALFRAIRESLRDNVLWHAGNVDGNDSLTVDQSVTEFHP